MKKKNQSRFVTLLIIIIIAIIAILVLTKNPAPKTDAETAQCIGSKSTLYTQLGCTHCKTQEDMFGENIQYLKIVDCFYDHQSCIDNEIGATPTWMIKGEKYEGVKSIDKLKELTGC